MTLFAGHNRLRSSHLDELSYVCSIIPSSSDANKLQKSFFYRTFMIWNSIPLKIRKLGSISEFRSKLEDHLWSSLLGADEGNGEDADLSDT